MYKVVLEEDKMKKNRNDIIYHNYSHIMSMME